MKTFDFTGPDVTPAPAGAAREIVYYDSIHDLPMFRLNEFQIHLCQDAGIGSQLKDFDKRLMGVYEALGHSDIPNAIKELQNANIGLYLMLGSISTSARCLADLVFSIDGVKLTDFSDDALLAVHKRICERMSANQVEALKEDLKKKFKRQLSVAFPELFSEDDEITFFAKIVRRAKLQIEDWRGGSQVPNPEILAIEAQLWEEMQPEIHNPNIPNNTIEEKRRSFEQVCTGLALHGIPNAELLTVFRFHSQILYIQQHKPQGKPAEANE